MVEIIIKYLSSKYSQKLLDHAKKSIQIYSKLLQKKAIGNHHTIIQILIHNRKIIRNTKKCIYISRKRQQIIDNLNLI